MTSVLYKPLMVSANAESVEIEGEDEPAEKEAEQVISLASLRNVIGS